MGRTLRSSAALVVVLAALAGPVAVRPAHAASAPPPTHTPIPTQTPYPTNTPYATATARPTYTPVPSATPAHHPAIALSSSQGISTTHIVAIVDDFPPATQVTLYWDDTPHVLGQHDVDASGYTRFDVTIPNAPVGPHEVRAVGAHHTSAGAPYNVTGPVVIGGGGGAAGLDPGAGSVAGGGCDGPLAIHIPVPFGSPLCVDTIGALTSVFVGAIQAVGGWIKAAMDKVTAAVAAPFVAVLTGTPDFSDRGSWGELGTFFDNMQDLAYGLYGVLSLIGLCKFGLAHVGRANVVEAVDVLWRAVLGLVAVMILPDVLHLWFVGLGDLTSTVLSYTGGTDAGVLTSHIALDAKTPGTLFGSASGAIWALTLMTLFGMIFTVVGLVILLLTALTKLVGLFLLATLYGISPLMVACWVLPEASGFTRGWAGAFINTSLWGVGYAVVLKMIVVMELGLHMIGLLQPLLGIAGLLVLYRVPKIIASLNPGGAVAQAAGAHAPAGAITGVAAAAVTGNAAKVAAGLVGKPGGV